jgi:hypothetical protein
MTGHVAAGGERVQSRPHARSDPLARAGLAAENRGDWYDVEAVVGLLNALLVARKSDTRLGMLQTGDQSVLVVAGPASGLESLADAGLLDVGDPHEPERVGKRAEDSAVQALQKDGHEEIHRDVSVSTP